MSINSVKTTVEQQSFKFLNDQSSILRTVNTNKITYNPVSVIVDKPKVGDIMCVTKYKDTEGNLLDANKQDIIWVDGFSVNPGFLYKELEPVGICLLTTMNKALVRYRKKEPALQWAVGERWELPYSSIMNDGAAHSLTVNLNGTAKANKLNLTSADTVSRAAFVNKLNAWFLANDTNYSAELVDLNSDIPAVDTSDNKDGNNYRNRIIINAKFITNAHNTVSIEGIGACTKAIAKHLKSCNWYYINNGWPRNWEGGCCFAKYYDWVQDNQTSPTSNLTSINISTSDWTGKFPARLDDFNENPFCKILRDNFDNYFDYINSFMVKQYNGAGGAITELPDGKKSTYQLANCTFLNNATGNQDVLYPAANYCYSLNVNGPGLTRGNWWLPSFGELAKIFYGINYKTSFWETNPDIINRIISKFMDTFAAEYWDYLDPNESYWSSSKYDEENPWHYSDWTGDLGSYQFWNYLSVFPITICEI